MDSCVLRPITIGAPIVMRLKNARSSGKRQGNWLLRPITPLRARATIRVSVVMVGISVSGFETNQAADSTRRPTTNDQRPTTNDQRPTTNDQRPTTNDQ